MAATTSDAKRLKTDAAPAPAPTKTDASIENEEEEAAADGTAITGES